MKLFNLLLLLGLISCSCRPHHEEYSKFYSHIKMIPYESQFKETDFYIIFLVNARHLDYSSTQHLLKTISKHPSDGSKNGDVGHAWIYLKGKDGILEGGHSGERGFMQPRYWEGVFENIERGAANPIAYLWCHQCDGFFQKGNGGHQPTCAIKVDLTEIQYDRINQFIASYPFDDYSLQEKQCASFITAIADLIEISLEDRVPISIDAEIVIQNNKFQLWEDPRYQTLIISSPDQLEKSLYELARKGRGKNVLKWYLKTYPCTFKQSLEKHLNRIHHFVERYCRYLMIGNPSE